MLCCLHSPNKRRSETICVRILEEAQEDKESETRRPTAVRVKWFSRKELLLPRRMLTALYDLKLLANTAVDENNPLHVQLLMVYYNNIVDQASTYRVCLNGLDSPTKFPVGMNDHRWMYVGFQSCNPFNDFRGCGLLGLLVLAYYSQRYKSQLHDTMSYALGFEDGTATTTTESHKSQLFLQSERIYNQHFGLSSDTYFAFAAVFLNIIYNIYCFFGVDNINFTKFNLSCSNAIAYCANSLSGFSNFRRVVQPGSVEEIASVLNYIERISNTSLMYEHLIYFITDMIASTINSEIKAIYPNSQDFCSKILEQIRAQLQEIG